MDTVLALPVDISEWKPAPFALGGETVFAIGDIHGCASANGAGFHSEMSTGSARTVSMPVMLELSLIHI